jgi:hypothetical protein
MKVKLHLSYQQGMVVQACNPSSQRQENGEFKVSLGYVVKLCLKKQNKTKQKQQKSSVPHKNMYNCYVSIKNERLAKWLKW